MKLRSVILDIVSLVGVVLIVACSRSGSLHEGTSPFTASELAALKEYCVIDLRGDGGQYGITYLDAPPDQGWGFEHKTEKLVLRLIRPGRFKFRGRYEAEITQPYYIGVFEVTWRQYSLIMGEPTDSYRVQWGERIDAPYDCAVDDFGWWQVRGNPHSANGTDPTVIDWPRTRGKDPRSILGRLEARTGRRFDLPTEFQWEFACGAESDTDYLSDDYHVWRKLPCKCLDSWDMRTINGFLDFRVGSMTPNERGLYDMHGNVAEWCLDAWDERYIPPARDAVGSSSTDGEWRIVKGGNIWSKVADCASTAVAREHTWLWAEQGYGFRVVMDVR